MKRVLVAIAYHGIKNENYVERLIATYSSFDKYDVDVVLLIEKQKITPAGADIIVGAPTSNPWSLPFQHRQLFSDKQNDYDYFIYSEDDTELLEKHLDAFVVAEQILPKNKILGFIRHEESSDGERFYSTVHHSYHFQKETRLSIGEEVFANYTNQHSACFILSRSHLEQCIASGGFLVEPHEGSYDMLCSAATDPYTQCGFDKLLWISRLDILSLHHLPGVYIGKIGIPEGEIHLQLKKLISDESSTSSRTSCSDAEPYFGVTTLQSREFDKPFYEDVRHSLIEIVPESATTVLSVMCERGLNESTLGKNGFEVSAICIDEIIEQSASSLGVTILPKHISHLDQFDCILFNNVLGYLEDPSQVLSEYLELLRPGGSVVVSFNNYNHPRYLHRQLRGDGDLKVIHNDPQFKTLNFHASNWHQVREWLRAANLIEVDAKHELSAPAGLKGICRLSIVQELLSICGSIRAIRKSESDNLSEVSA